MLPPKAEHTAAEGTISSEEAVRSEEGSATRGRQSRATGSVRKCRLWAGSSWRRGARAL